MTTQFNTIFKQLLTDYNLPEDLSFSVDLPVDVENIINDEIVVNEFGVTLKSFGGLYKAGESWNNQSLVEDFENHFHVDWLIVPPDNKKAFMLAVATLISLAEKFEKANHKAIRFWLSYQTPELGQACADANNIDDKEHYISDRLSFHTRRNGEEVTSIDPDDNTFSAVLIIDI